MGQNYTRRRAVTFICESRTSALLRPASVSIRGQARGRNQISLQKLEETCQIIERGGKISGSDTKLPSNYLRL